MGYKLIETRLASQDLDNILDTWLSACKILRLRAKGYRKAVIRNYVLIYKVDEKNRTVLLLRFFYGKQDYAAKL